MVNFFTHEEEERIIQAIREAEAQTSGEIRVHLQSKLKGDVLKAARFTFFRLGMERTADRNGVLFFIAPNQQQFAIIGDEGVNKVVPEGFWEDARNLATGYFKKKEFAEGVCATIRLIGQKLQAHFPHRKTDANELPDKLSIQ